MASVLIQGGPSKRLPIAYVGAHCDLRQRLEDAPPSASIRGIWFKILEGQLDERGLRGQYDEFFEARSWGSMRHYWVGEYLTRVSVLGALIAGPENLHDGMKDALRVNAAGFSRSLLGKTLLRLLSPDPVRLIHQGVAARRQTMSYGRWRVENPSPGHLQVRADEEYIWIESCVLGAFVGTMEAIGKAAQVTADLEDKYNGVIDIRWDTSL